MASPELSQEDLRRSPTEPSSSPDMDPSELLQEEPRRSSALKETGASVTDVVSGEVVTPRDVIKLDEITALTTAVKVAEAGSRDLFESLVAGSMPALMPGQGYIKSGNRLVSVDYHAKNGKFRDSAMLGGHWGSAAEARAQALPTLPKSKISPDSVAGRALRGSYANQLKLQEDERNTRRQQEVQAKNAALQDEVRAKNAALRDYMKKHYSNRPMSRPEQIDAEKEFDWFWDRRQARRKATGEL